MSDVRPPGGGVRALARWRRRPRPDEIRRLADPERVARILILKPHDQLGDFLLATPACHALRVRYPRARVVLVTREFLAPLARRNRDLDEVWVLPRLAGPRSLGALAAALARLRGFRPELAVVMNSVSRSKSADAFALLSGARVIAGRSRVGAGPLPDSAPADPGAAALARPASDPVYDLDLDAGRASVHQSERLLDLVRWTGAAAEGRALRLDLADAERVAGRVRLDEAWRSADPGRAEAGATPALVGLHPGAANPLKCWPLESFVALGEALAAGGAGAPGLVVFDSPRQPGRAAAVVAGLAARGVAAGLVPPAGIETFAAACAALDLLVCNDSGVMHVAAALGVPTVSFHSLGRPPEWGPRGDRAVALYAPGDIAAIPVEAAAEAVRALRALPAPRA